MNSFNLDYSGAHRDESQDPRDGGSSHLQSSLAAHDPSLMGFPNSHVGDYPFGAMLPQHGDLGLQTFDRPPGQQEDHEGRLSGVMLTYDSANSGVSMPLNLDGSGAFAYDAPATYPASSMGLAPPMDHTALHSGFHPFPQSLPHAPGHYLQQPSAPSQIQPRKDHQPYPILDPNTTGNFANSGVSRAAERSQQQVPRPIQEQQRIPQPAQPAPYRASQPVAIQPKKKPATTKGKCRALEKPLLRYAVLTRILRLKTCRQD